MRPALLALVGGLAVALAGAACSGGSGTKVGGTTLGATPGGQQGNPNADLSKADFSSLIYWEGLNFYGGVIPEAPLQLFLDMAASGDKRYASYFLDLAALPTPYEARAVDVLKVLLGPFGDFGTFDWVERRGFLGPEDDSPQYLAFKHRLLATLQQEIGDFVRPEAKRAISGQEILWGGVCVDCIPPLETPKLVTPAQADAWISPVDQVIGIEINGDARAYPRRIIDWHEMVNDTVGGVPVSLAYCTLCGSAILYDGRVGGRVFDFGTSGLLYRSNKLMYDRQTRTLWEQYTGEPVWGELVGSGIQLEILPAVHTTYGEWLRDHPGTKVLDIETGFQRDYGSGVAYEDYFASPQLMFPAPDRSGPLKVKDVVFAVRVEGELTAYPVNLLASRGFVQDRIGSKGVVVVGTGDGSGGRAFADGGVTFTAADRKAGRLTSQDGREWQVTETALVGSDGTRLERLPGHNSFWFSVINHTSNGRLYGQ
ncbi:MAG: DUF3179 domain-containing protein [Tepidiformaceae bacterium]